MSVQSRHDAFQLGVAAVVLEAKNANASGDPCGYYHAEAMEHVERVRRLNGDEDAAIVERAFHRTLDALSDPDNKLLAEALETWDESDAA